MSTSATRSLTDKPISRDSKSEDGKVVAVHTTEVVTDPTAENAVQVPNPSEYPSANATALNDLARLLTTSPADALDNDETDVNEVQTVTKSGTVSGGTYTLTLPAALGGGTTSAIAFDATAATVQTALNVALGDTWDKDDDGDNNIVVTGGPVSSTALTFTFSGEDVAGRNWAQIVSDDAAITGGGTLVDATSVQGAHADD